MARLFTIAFLPNLAEPFYTYCRFYRTVFIRSRRLLKSAGFVREGKKVANPKAKTVEKDLFFLTYEDLKDFDVVIDAFGAWTEETLPLHRTSLKHLCDILSGSNIRLLVVGGAGSLYVNKEHAMQVKDTPGFPDIYKPLANMQGAALDDLRKRSDVKWTFLSPAGDFVADGERTGEYLLGGEEYFVNSKGESRISYSDYAIAMIDEIENCNNVQKRFSVIGK